MDKTYDPHQVEKRWYERWEEEGRFVPGASGGAAGEPYCIMLPPPNVTGTLHMGHAFQDTIMDTLIRYHRMNGRKTLWQPGTDPRRNRHPDGGRAPDQHGRADPSGPRPGRLRGAHLALEGALGQHDHQPDETHGASVDWAHERFTMDEGLSGAVRETFVPALRSGPDLPRQAPSSTGTRSCRPRSPIWRSSPRRRTASSGTSATRGPTAPAAWRWRRRGRRRCSATRRSRSIRRLPLP